MSAQSKADAASRGWRTAFQGAVSVAVVAAAATVVDVVTPGEVVDLPTLGVAVGTAAGTALAAWAHRLLGGDPAPQE